MHFFLTVAYTGLYVIFVRKGMPCMDECMTAAAPTPVLTEPTGDVDDLIFFHSPEWNASER